MDVKNIMPIQHGANKNGAVIVPNYFFLLNDLTEKEKLFLMILSMMAKFKKKDMAKLMHISIETTEKMLLSLHTKRYLHIEKGQTHINTLTLYHNAKVDKNKDLFETMSHTSNLNISPFFVKEVDDMIEEPKINEVSLVQDMAKDLKEVRIKRAKENAEISKQCRAIYRKNIDELYKIFNTPQLIKILTTLKNRLGLVRDKEFSTICASLLQNNKKGIITGTVAFYDKLLVGEIYSSSIYVQRTIWIAFVKKQRVQQSTNKQLERIDPHYKQKMEIVRQIRIGETPIEESFKDNVGKLLRINDSPYLPNPLTEMYLYNKYPLFGGDNDVPAT